MDLRHLHEERRGLQTLIWSVQTIWYDVAVISTIAVGNILFGHFEIKNPNTDGYQRWPC